MRDNEKITIITFFPIVGRTLYFVDAENKTTNPIDEFCMPTKKKTNLGLASAAKTIY